MSRKHVLSGAAIALILFLALSMAIAAIPANQDALTTDQQLIETLSFDHTQQSVERQVNRDQSTSISAIYSTVDSQQIATLVSTFTATGIPSFTPSPTLTSTLTPSVFASSTQEILTPFSATPTFQNMTNSPTPTRSPTPVSGATSTRTPSPTDLPQIVIATNVSGSNLRIRSTCSLSGEVLGYIYAADRPETPYQDNQVALDLSAGEVTADGYNWHRLWNWNDGGGCIAHERISPYLMLLNW